MNAATPKDREALAEHARRLQTRDILERTFLEIVRNRYPAPPGHSWVISRDEPGPTSPVGDSGAIARTTEAPAG